MSFEGWKETNIERVPSDWNIVRLGEIATLINGRAFKHSEFKSEGTPIVRIQNLRGDGSGKYVFSDLELPDDKYINNGDLIYAWSATFGPFIWKGHRSIYHYHIWKVICSELVDKYFLYYKLKYITDRVQSQGTGSIFTHITKTLMEKQELGIPNIDEQKRIASILSSLDEKIELNNQINKDLEEMAQAIFRSWFVDFEPFQDGEFVESELGPIPKGWEVRKLGEITELIKDGTHNPPKRVLKGIPLITGVTIKNGFIDYEKMTYITEKDYQKIHKKYQPQEGDLLITKIGTLGKVAILREHDLPVAIHCNCALIRFNQNFVTRFYGYYLLKSEMFQREFHKRKQQTVQEFINLTQIAEIPVIVPDNKILKEYELVIKPIFEKISSLNIQNQILSQLRDTLLPKLMSGEIRVPITSEGGDTENEHLCRVGS